MKIFFLHSAKNVMPAHRYFTTSFAWKLAFFECDKINRSIQIARKTIRDQSLGICTSILQKEMACKAESSAIIVPILRGKKRAFIIRQN